MIAAVARMVLTVIRCSVETISYCIPKPPKRKLIVANPDPLRILKTVDGYILQ
jgi:hypothetical protein